MYIWIEYKDERNKAVGTDGIVIEMLSALDNLGIHNITETN